MIFTLKTFTLIHVLISLIGIGSGLVVLFGWLTRRQFNGWTVLFLVTTILTSVTGFFFPVDHPLPSHIVGIISLVILAVALLARYVFHLAGAWGRIFVVTSVIALYLNVFVLVVQMFLKIPALTSLAPTQTEPPFLVAQLLVLLLFIVLGAIATIRFHSQPAPQQLRAT